MKPECRERLMMIIRSWKEKQLSDIENNIVKSERADRWSQKEYYLREAPCD
ncbi:MAG: hypothetical protein ACLSA6_18555 [Holdemania massiliensis]